MKLLTKELLRKIPRLLEQEEKGLDATVYVKYISPWSGWIWFATEFDGKDTFFGLVVGTYNELGYFSLSDLQSIVWKIERDRFFKPKTLNELMIQYPFGLNKAT